MFLNRNETALGLSLMAVVLFASVAQAGTLPVIDGLQLRLDATDSSPVVEGTTMTWADLSGQENHMTQTDPQRHPTLVGDVLNGEPVVRFDGADDYLESFMDTGGEMTLFVVFASTRDPLGANDVDTLLAGRGAANDELLVYSMGWENPAPSSPVFDVSHRDPGPPFRGNRVAYINGENVDTREGGLSIETGEFVLGSATTSQIPASSTLRVGAFVDDRFYGQNDIASILLYNVSLTDPQRQSVEGYLLEKYAIPEPTTLMLLATGGFALLVGLLRRRRAH